MRTHKIARTLATTAAVTMMGVLGAPSLALAGPKDEDLRERREEAAKLHQEASVLYTKGDFEGARVKFHEAYARSQNPNSLLNEARATMKGYHYLEAAKLLRVYLALPENDKVTAADRKSAEVLLDDASGKLCTLDLRVSSCTVDGTAGQGLLMVEVGEHLVRMQGPKGEKLKSVKCSPRETVLVTYEDEPAKGGTGPGPVTPPPKEEGEKGSWLVPGVLAGVGLVGMGVGVGLGVATSSKESSIETMASSRPCDARGNGCTEVVDALASAKGTRTGFIVGYAVGGAALAGALISTLIIRPWETRPRSTAGQLVPMVSPDSGGLLVTGSF